MAAPNTKPIMPLTPNNGSVAIGGSFVKLTAANTAMDGTGTVLRLAVTAARGLID